MKPAVLHTDLASAVEGIDMVLLLGGPAGSGKTTYARHLVDGSAMSSFLEGYRGSMSRSDAKSLPCKRFVPGVLIVEFATNRLHGPEKVHSTKAYIQALQHRVPVVGAHTIEIGTWPLIGRYLKRMRGLQFLHYGKLKTLAYYAMARRAQEDLANWKALLAECGIEDRPLSAHAVPYGELTIGKTPLSKAA